jgi:hypothetical protein
MRLWLEVGPKLALAIQRWFLAIRLPIASFRFFSVYGPLRFMPSWRLNKSRARAWLDTEDHDHAAFEATRP